MLFKNWVKEVTTSEWIRNARVNENIPEWNQRISVKKGNVGERIVKYILEQNGWIVYRCATHNTPHVVDFVSYKNKKTVRFFEVKSKKYMRNPDRTGFNTADFETYKHFLKEHKQDIFLIFVDEAKSEIYGNYLSKLIEEKIEGNIIFPHQFISKRDGKSITTFPLSSMVPIAKLTDDQIKELIKYTFKKDENNNF